MLIIFEKTKFQQLIKELNGLPASTTQEELILLHEQYGERLFKVLADDYGLKLIGEGGQQGSLTGMRFECTSHDVGRTIEGLNFVRPVCVSIDAFDVPKLVPGRTGRDLIAGGWHSIAHLLAKIQPNQIQDRLEEAAGKILNESNRQREAASQRPDGITDEQWLESVSQRRAFEDTMLAEYCLENGLRVPGGKQRAHNAEQYELARAEAKRREERENRWARNEQAGENDSSWGVREV